MIFFKSLQAARGQHGGSGSQWQRAHHASKPQTQFGQICPSHAAVSAAVSAAGATQEEGEEQGGPH